MYRRVSDLEQYCLIMYDPIHLCLYNLYTNKGIFVPKHRYYDRRSLDKNKWKNLQVFKKKNMQRGKKNRINKINLTAISIKIPFQLDSCSNTDPIFPIAQLKETLY